MPDYPPTHNFTKAVPVDIEFTGRTGTECRTGDFRWSVVKDGVKSCIFANAFLNEILVTKAGLGVVLNINKVSENEWEVKYPGGEMAVNHHEEATPEEKSMQKELKKKVLPPPSNDMSKNDWYEKELREIRGKCFAYSSSMNTSMEEGAAEQYAQVSELAGRIFKTIIGGFEIEEEGKRKKIAAEIGRHRETMAV